mgnify:CR=1 FL=1
MEQFTFSYYRETRDKDKVDDSRSANATLREDECFGTRVMFETSGDKRVGIIEVCMKDEASTMAQFCYDGTTGEGVQQATFLTYDETTRKGKAEDSRAGNAALRVNECFGTHSMSEILSDEEASMSKACMIEENVGCKAYTVDEVAANDKIKEVGVNNTTRADNDHGENFSTLVPKIWQLRPKANVSRPNRGKVAARKRRSKLICAMKREA